MRSVRWGIPVVLAFLVVRAPSLSAHGDLHEQIKVVTAKIERDPRNALLYLERGGLYRAHRQWNLSLADCGHAIQLNVALTDARLCRGLTLGAAGRHRAADRALTRLLNEHPEIVGARIARARSRVAMGRPLDADPDYAAALASNPNPDWYLERAHALRQAKQPTAIDVLDGAIAVLGPLVTLQDAAVQLDVDAGRYDRALSRIDTVLAQNARSPAWLLRRADLLQRDGRQEEARKAYETTIVAINDLPASRRYTRAMADVRTRANAGLVRAR